MSLLQLIINPGSTSTKLALYDDDRKLVQTNIEHRREDLLVYERLQDQVPFRLGLIHDFLAQNLPANRGLSAVVARGGLVFGLKTGGYEVNEELCEALTNPEFSEMHASNLGGLLAREISLENNVPAYIYDAVTSGALTQVAQITGLAEVRRRSFCHILNSRAQAMRYAATLGKRYEDLNLLVVHLGGGVSASVHCRGSIIDSVGDDDGQFSPERSGSFPSLEIVRLCFSGKYTKEQMEKKIRGKGGMYAHLGTSDCREIERMVLAGDRHAELIFQAQAYQIAKTVGLLSIVLKGRCNAIILTGGMAYSRMLTDLITDYVGFLAPVVVMPGENEMEALAQGGLRILRGEEPVNTYYLPERKDSLWS